MSTPGFCTILARNYLPKALALADSVRTHHGDTPLTIFLIDATEHSVLPAVDGVRWMHPGDLDLGEDTVRELLMSYDLVEFATAVKPLILKKLLREYPQVAYLDPDTFVTAPLDEVGPALEAGSGIVLTPHYLLPPPSGMRFSDSHLLHVGVYNLGFCAVSRAAHEFLDWWWGHLRTECLHDPTAGLFVDQKWMDIGSVLFNALALRHFGYNVGIGNLHERAIERDGQGYRIAGTGDALRLFHFHAFDPQRPDELCTRSHYLAAEADSQPDVGNEALRQLCHDYARLLLEKHKMVGPQPDYPYRHDMTGRRITKRLRHAYRLCVQSGSVPPSPFLQAQAGDYARWRHGAWRLTGRIVLSDIIKSARFTFPDEFDHLKRRLPALTDTTRGRLVEKTGMWG